LEVPVKLRKCHTLIKKGPSRGKEQGLIRKEEERKLPAKWLPGGVGFCSSAKNNQNKGEGLGGVRGTEGKGRAK